MIAKLIIERAQYHALQTITTPVGYVLLNEAIRETASICPKARVPGNITIAAVKNTWYDLPATTISVENVTDSEGEDFTKYDVDGLRIKFHEDGEYTVEFKRMPADIARGVESAVPEMHELFHHKLEYYIAARVRFNFNHEDGEGNRLLNEFYDGIRVVDSTLSKGKPKKKLPAPIWR